METIKLEIGANLSQAIQEMTRKIVAEGGIYHGQVGSQIREAFGIDFSKAIESYQASGILPSGRKWTLEVE